MCILCVIQKWSRRIATMLPWLVIPLIGLWFLSQFLPPTFRFEITSPRLACVFVLLITLFWYEVLMPQLSSWRIRRNARLRERKRFEAIEMQKLRKTATRRCRNCLTPYRDQNPGGGKFMCSYCGHISKRPVLDLPIPPGLNGLSNSAILKDLVGKGGKMLNGKVWSDNGWICGQDWLENSGNWVNGSFSGKSSFRAGDDHCFAEKSYSRFVVFLCKILAGIFLGIMWLWRKIFRVSSSDEDASTDSEIRNLGKKREIGVNFNESKSEKARRKAEEKRQARLEKEQLEEEERKQREEVARLVEERRKLRDEKTESEKDTSKISSREKINKREIEKKGQQKKKEKDISPSKSNDLEKRVIKETDKSKHHRIGTENLKFNDNTDITYGSKIVATNNNNNIGNAGTRYLDRMRGTFLSSSRAFTGGGFFGKGTTANASSTREQKSSVSLDHVQNVTPIRKEVLQPVKSNVSADDKNINRPAHIDSQPGPKKSWQQLFTRTPTVDLSCNNKNVISRPHGKLQKDIQNPELIQGFDNNQTTFGLPNSLPNFAYKDPVINNSIFPRAPDKFLPEESDIFEDPCYVPDPVSLIGPVSESLDNFELDLGFVPNLGFQKPKNDLSEISKPSPIESPMTRFVTNEEQIKGNEKGWQMWDSFGLAGDLSSWLLSPALQPQSQSQSQSQNQKTMASLFKKDEQKPYTRFVNATEDGSWMHYGPVSGHDKGFYGNYNGSAINHPFQLSQGNFWANKEKATVEGNRGSASRPVGGLYANPAQMYSRFGHMNG